MNTVKKITLISLITAFMCCTIFCVPTSALLLNWIYVNTMDTKS